MMHPHCLASTTARLPGLFLRLLVLAIGLPFLGASCAWHHHYAAFKGPEHLGFTTPTLRAYVDPSYECKNYGFIWGTTTNAPPYALALYSEEPTGAVFEVVITDLQVTHRDKNRVIGPAQLPATATYEDKSYGPPDDRTQEFRAELKFKSLIDRNESFTLLLRGYYLMKDGSKRTFESKEYFEMTEKNEFTSMWAEMMSV